jgi:hypothetical protein
MRMGVEASLRNVRLNNSFKTMAFAKNSQIVNCCYYFYPRNYYKCRNCSRIDTACTAGANIDCCQISGCAINPTETKQMV